MTDILIKIAAVVLAISLLGNVFLGKAYLSQRDSTAVATTQVKQADGVALACSDGVKAMDTQADKRYAEGAPKVADSAKKAQVAGKLAVQIISAPPAVPGDACKSAQAALDDWWERRAKP